MARKKAKLVVPKQPDKIWIETCGNRLSAYGEAEIQDLLTRNAVLRSQALAPVPMILHCPECTERHIDEGEFATKHHHTHACQHCGFVWRPAVRDTVGVKFLPGFKNGPACCEWLPEQGIFKITQVENEQEKPNAESGSRSAGGNSAVVS